MTRMAASAVTTAQTMDAIHIHLSTTVRVHADDREQGQDEGLQQYESRHHPFSDQLMRVAMHSAKHQTMGRREQGDVLL